MQKACIYIYMTHSHTHRIKDDTYGSTYSHTYYIYNTFSQILSNNHGLEHTIQYTHMFKRSHI